MNKLLYFFKPYFDYIDAGLLFKKPFYWLYAVFAGLNLLAPLLIIIGAFSNNIFDLPGKFTFAFLFIWVFSAVAHVLGFQLWWRRKDQVMEQSKEGSDFVATPVYAHLVQTSGEFLGSYLAILFTGIGLISTIILGGDAGRIVRFFPVPVPVDNAFVLIFMGPAIGFFLIVSFRVLAELIRALASIANNTSGATDKLPGNAPLVP